MDGAKYSSFITSFIVIIVSSLVLGIPATTLETVNTLMKQTSGRQAEIQQNSPRHRRDQRETITSPYEEERTLHHRKIKTHKHNLHHHRKPIHFNNGFSNLIDLFGNYLNTFGRPPAPQIINIFHQGNYGNNGGIQNPHGIHSSDNHYEVWEQVEDYGPSNWFGWSGFNSQLSQFPFKKIENKIAPKNIKTYATG